VLERRAARLMGTARRLSRETGETAHLYSECRYAAGTWPKRLLPGSRSYEMRARILAVGATIGTLTFALAGL
jgi:hypothetical protein